MFNFLKPAIFMLFATTCPLYGMKNCYNALKQKVSQHKGKATASAFGVVSLAHAYKQTATFGKRTTEKEPVTIFSHGLGADKNQAYYYHTESRNPAAFIEGQLESSDFKDVHNPSTSCLGQEADIHTLHTEVQKQKDCDLVGCSRGAVTIANYAGTHKLDNVGSMILESPFDDIKSVVQHKTGFASFTSALSALNNHNPQGIQPIKVAHKVQKDKPIFIYCSKKDKLIPAQSTINYYNALRKSEHDKVYLLVIESGEHANILSGSDGEMVRNVIHAFKKEHNRPYNATWAAAGEARYKQCQPAFVEAAPKKTSWFSSLSS